jgi:SAM-dependent methyltransferase
VTPSAVGALYDALQAFEGPRRGGGAYPIHKRITFPGTEQEDVYEWLGDQLALRSTDRVLDVGCGVGFGTIRLAERGVAQATGLTISEGELDRASRAASRSRRADAIAFLEGSFDQLPCGTFDVIVAVESLKHSSDLGATLSGLREALAPGGRLVVVEDVFDGDPSCASARRVVSDWLLTTLYREGDYAAALSPAACRVIDLTVGVLPSSRFALAGKLGALNLALSWQGPSRAAALRAFRGGLHLEKLYAASMVRYVAMFWSKDDAGPR